MTNPYPNPNPNPNSFDPIQSTPQPAPQANSPYFQQEPYVAVPPVYAQQYPAQPVYAANPVSASPQSWIAALLLCFFFGTLGVHNFYLGYVGRGIAQLILGILGWGTLWFFGFGLLFLIPMWIWVFVEFVLLLVSSAGYGSRNARGIPLTR